MDDAEQIVWFNGDLMPSHEAVVAATDPVVQVGVGLFETILGVDGRPVWLNQHLQRLEEGLMRFEILGPPSDELRGVLVDAARRLCAANQASEGLSRLRFTLTAGGDALLTGVPYERPTEPAILATSAYLRNPYSPLVGLKSTSYAESALALAEAQNSDATEALFGNTDGDLCEGSCTNVFVVKDGRIATPALSSGCLPGIARATLLEALAETDHEVEERSIPMAEVDAADEVFITSSLRLVQAVAQIDGRDLRGGSGPVTQIAAQALSQLA